jgi:hypothetical protein
VAPHGRPRLWRRVPPVVARQGARPLWFGKVADRCGSAPDAGKDRGQGPPGCAPPAAGCHQSQASRGHGGGPALAWPVAAPNMLPDSSSVRTSTVSPPPSVQLVIFASCRPATSAATLHGAPGLIPRSASAPAKAARSAADAALEAITADWASRRSSAMAIITTNPNPAARTVPDPRSEKLPGSASSGGFCSGSPSFVGPFLCSGLAGVFAGLPGAGFPCVGFPCVGFPCAGFPGVGFPCGVMTPRPLRSAPEVAAQAGKTAAPRDGCPQRRPFRREPVPGRTVSRAPSFRPGRTPCPRP